MHYKNSTLSSILTVHMTGTLEGKLCTIAIITNGEYRDKRIKQSFQYSISDS